MVADGIVCHCPICEGKSEVYYCSGQHQMFKCKDCETAFLYPMPSAEFLDKFYAQFHKSFETGGGYELFEAASSRSFNRKIKIIKQRVKSSGEKIRLLDVGCGKGYFVEKCVEAGMDAQGIDLSSTAIEFARNAGRPCNRGRVEDIDSKKHQFDVVTFWATIEHLPDLLSALIKIRELLTPGGALFFDTGVGSDWLDNLLPGVVQWYDPPQHLFVFSPEGIKVVLQKANLEVKSIDLNFESSNLRKVLKSIRGIFFGTVVRSATCLARVRQSPILFTRYALGNLMLIEARKGVAPDEFENK